MEVKTTDATSASGATTAQATQRRDPAMSQGSTSTGTRPRNNAPEIEATSNYNTVIRRAVTSGRYRRRLIANSKAVLEEAGIPVPAEVEVRVRTFDDNTRYLFLPPEDSGVARAMETSLRAASTVATERGQEASVSVNWWSGVVLTLEHEEVQTILQYIDAGRDVVEFLKGLDLLTLEHEEVQTILQYIDAGRDVVEFLKGLDLPIADLAFTVIGLYLRIQAGLIRGLDRGNGIYLTLPWPAVWWQQWWLIIPGPR